MCALKKNMGFQMGSSCFSFGRERSTAFFVLVTSDLGLEEQKWELLFSAVFHGDEKIPSSGHGVSLPPAHPDTSFRASSSQVTHFLFHWGLSLCKKSDEFSGVVLPYPLGAFVFQMRFDLFSKIGKFPRVGENAVWLGWTSDIGRGRALEWEQDWIGSKPEQRFYHQRRSNCSLAPGVMPKWSVHSFREKHLQTNLLHPAESKGLSSRG